MSYTRRRRRDGIYFRNWDQSWYTTVRGRQFPLRDEHGHKIKGRHNEPAAKRAHARLILASPSVGSPSDSLTLHDVFVAYLAKLKQTAAA